jgi:hypothetical protein
VQLIDLKNRAAVVEVAPRLPVYGIGIHLTSKRRKGLEEGGVSAVLTYPRLWVELRPEEVIGILVGVVLQCWVGTVDSLGCLEPVKEGGGSTWETNMGEIGGGATICEVDHVIMVKFVAYFG